MAASKPSKLNPQLISEVCLMRMRLSNALRALPIIALLLLSGRADASFTISQPSTTFVESQAVFPNPERGWFWPYNPICCSTNQPHGPLNVTELRNLRSRPEAITLIRDAVQLGQHMTGPISQATLDKINADWNAARQAGVKVIARFLYDWSLNNRDPEESVLMGHLAQLEPLLQANEDVIFALEAGLFGSTGEAVGSDHGYVVGFPQRLSAAGIRIYQRLRQALPASRQMLLRYPRLKWDMLGSMTIAPCSNKQFGYYDDGWLGDINHFAFFRLTGERAFTEADTACVIMHGEPSLTSSTNTNMTMVMADLTKLHHISMNLNNQDAAGMYTAWRSTPQWNEILLRYGYRIVLNRMDLADASGKLRVTLSLTNRGFAPIMNQRPTVLVLRNRSTGALTRIPLAYDIRTLAAGATALPSEEVSLPPAGAYDVGLHLPDAAASIAGRPEYAVRLASENIWDAATGIHWLGPIVTVASEPPPPVNASVSLVTAGTGSGTVSGAGTFPVGSTVTLTATPAADSTFAGWSPAPCAASFTLTANLVCTATFTLNPPPPPGTEPPHVAITVPSANALLARGSTIIITAVATSDVGIAKVEFLVNGVVKCIELQTPYTCSWTVPMAANKTYQIQARAYDANGAVSTASIAVRSQK
jgi:hypothetical protein